MLDPVKADCTAGDGLSDAGQHVLGAQHSSSRRKSWKNSALPRLAMRASIRRRSVANSSGRSQPTSGAGWSRAPILRSRQSQVMQRVENEVLTLVGAPMTGDHLSSAG